MTARIQWCGKSCNLSWENIKKSETKDLMNIQHEREYFPPWTYISNSVMIPKLHAIGVTNRIMQSVLKCMLNMTISDRLFISSSAEG
jgi:hypothetical protein